MSPSPSWSHSITVSPLPPKNKSVLKKKKKVPLIHSMPNQMTTAMASALFERKRLRGERRMDGAALIRLPDRHSQYLRRAVSLSGWLQTSYHAEINEPTLRKVSWPTH